MFASGVDAAPDLLPFAYGLVQTKASTCERSRDKCVKIIRALAAANKMITEKPDEALGILRKRFAQMDQELLAAAFKTVAAAHARDLRVNEAMLANSERVSLEAKLLDPKDKLQSYAGLYTDAYVVR
jgi:ABC-type nitrate/sulfonate/bicarbonate transport system substrate-binding protein